MAIYTKRGDKGETSLFSRKKEVRISKTSIKINAIGSIDELNSFLGTIGSLKDIQKDLFTVNSILAGAALKFSKTKTKKLEKEIDRLEGSLPVLKNFVVYGGSQKASKLFYARALARRAERATVSLANLEKVKPQILTYLNRLSDYLFMKAREVNHKEGIKEEVWKA